MTTGKAQMQEETIMTLFDRDRIFRGHLTSERGHRDEHDTYRGRMDGYSYYDADDVYSRRIDTNGDVYSADDRYIGTIDANGDIYDASGTYIGHVDD